MDWILGHRGSHTYLKALKNHHHHKKKTQNKQIKTETGQHRNESSLAGLSMTLNLIVCPDVFLAELANMKIDDISKGIQKSKNGQDLLTEH